MTVERPALHVLCFAPLGGATDHLRHLWSCAATEPFPEGDLADEWYRQLGRCGDATVFAAHDAIGVAVRLDGDDWADIAARWHDATGGRPAPADVLGEVHVYSGVTTEPAPTEPRQHLSRVVGGDDTIELFAAVKGGVGVWEREGDGPRTFVVTAPRGELLDAWLDPTPLDLPGFARYLLHAAKLRYEVGVFQRSVTAIRARERSVDAALDELLALTETQGALPRPSETAQVEEVLDRARKDSTALLLSLTRMRDLQLTVEIACHNLTSYRPEGEGEAGDGGSPFDRDSDLGEWLTEQIGREILYLSSVRERAVEVQGLTSFRVDQATASHARVLNRLTLLQTSVLGALLAGVGVAGTFGEPIDLTGSLRLPVLFVVMAIALALPPVVVRWYERYGAFEILGTGGVGASAGWLIVVLADRSPPVALTLAAAVVGGVVLAGALHVVNRRVSG